MNRALLFLTSMFVRKSEPIDNDEELFKENEEEVVDGICHFDRLPVELIGEIYNKLPYQYATRLRRTNRRMHAAYEKCRRRMAGPVLSVYVKVEDGQVVTHARRLDKIREEALLIPQHQRNTVFRNARITLLIRLGENVMTDEIGATILGMFQCSQLEVVRLRAASVSLETKDLLNSLETERVDVGTGRFDDTVVKIKNLKTLDIRSELLFFQFATIVRTNPCLDHFTANVTAASLPLLKTCIDEWRQSKRDIAGWNFRVPQVDFQSYFEGVSLDWRISHTMRDDGKQRLRLRTKTDEVRPGDRFVYQSVCWMQC
uniref:F-box domain-containing protein n=1 Tax=Caenorhabditis japonica TaxID=281687 RepID=A0A8R1DL93_CAEJA